MRRRPPPNALDSQRRPYRTPYEPNANDIQPPLRRGPPGAPPDVKSFAVTTFDGRQNLMRDFDVKIPRGGFVNGLNLSMPNVSGAPVVEAPTQFLYPLDLTNGLSDIGPNSFADATIIGPGTIIAVPSFPRGSGYNNSATSGDELNFPVGIAGDVQANNWTVEFWMRGTNWGTGIVTEGMLLIGGPTAGTPNTLAMRSESGVLHVIVTPIAGVTQNLNTGFLLANNTTHFFSVTRKADRIFVHVDGTLVSSLLLTATIGKTFSWAASPIRFPYDETSPVSGQMGDFRFSNAAIYNASNYLAPSAPLQSQNSGGTNFAQYAMRVPDGFRMIIRDVTIAGGVNFIDDANGRVVALTSAAGPSDDFFGAIESAPQMAFYRDGAPINDLFFGQTANIPNTNNIGDLLFGPIGVEMYEIFDAGSIFAVGVALNPRYVAGRALFTVSDQTYCYVHGQIIPSDADEIQETGLTKVPLPTRKTEGLKL